MEPASDSESEDCSAGSDVVESTSALGLTRPSCHGTTALVGVSASANRGSLAAVPTGGAEGARSPWRDLDKWDPVNWESLSLSEIGCRLKKYIVAEPTLMGGRAKRILDGIQIKAFGAGRDLLPMPLHLGSVEELEQRIDDLREVAEDDDGNPWMRGKRVEKRSEGVRSWLWIIMLALNAAYCGAAPGEAIRLPRVASKAQCLAFAELEHAVMHFVELPASSMPVKDWSAYLRESNIGYNGQEVLRAMKLTWDQLEPALPPQRFCGCIDIMELVDGPVKDYLERPEDALVDLATVSERPRPGSCMIERGEELRIAKGLLARNMVIPLKRSELVHIGGEPLVNGVFGVTKGKVVKDESSKWVGKDVLRLIMNLTATNEVSLDSGGDIEKLPFAGQWRAIVLERREVLLLSFEDLSITASLTSFGICLSLILAFSE